MTKYYMSKNYNALQKYQREDQDDQQDLISMQMRMLSSLLILDNLSLPEFLYRFRQEHMEGLHPEVGWH